jgi:hypothetical protein
MKITVEFKCRRSKNGEYYIVDDRQIKAIEADKQDECLILEESFRVALKEAGMLVKRIKMK